MSGGKKEEGGPPIECGKNSNRQGAEVGGGGDEAASETSLVAVTGAFASHVPLEPIKRLREEEKERYYK